MNARGVVIGQAETATPAPYAPNCSTPDCVTLLGFEWDRGVLTKLPSLGGFNDAPFAINNAGVIAGLSYIKALDSATGFPESRATLWKDGTILNLRTPGGGTESAEFGMNDRGQITGPWSNGIPSPYSCQFFNC